MAVIKVDFPDYVGRVKEHYQRNKKKYIIGSYVLAITAGGAIVYWATKDGALGAVDIDVSPTFSEIEFGDNGTLNNITYIMSKRQGPPSWVVWCEETEEAFMSQHSAAVAKGISQTTMSKHLNGSLETADGLHFKRLCLAV
jgi:hypothetical protein